MNKNDREREEKRCGGCDCYEGEDGCECRRVPCSKCGSRDHMYNMEHPQFHTHYWFNGMPFEIKLNEVLCSNCSCGGFSDCEGDY